MSRRVYLLSKKMHSDPQDRLILNLVQNRTILHWFKGEFICKFGMNTLLFGNAIYVSLYVSFCDSCKDPVNCTVQLPCTRSFVFIVIHFDAAVYFTSCQ